MGRKKITIKPISDDKTRKVTFNRRRNGILKKAHELAILCDTQVVVLMFDGKQMCHVYASEEGIEAPQRLMEKFIAKDFCTVDPIRNYDTSPDLQLEDPTQAVWRVSKEKVAVVNTYSVIPNTSDTPRLGNATPHLGGKKGNNDDDDDDDDLDGSEQLHVRSQRSYHTTRATPPGMQADHPTRLGSHLHTPALTEREGSHSPDMRSRAAQQQRQQQQQQRGQAMQQVAAAAMSSRYLLPEGHAQTQASLAMQQGLGISNSGYTPLLSGEQGFGPALYPTQQQQHPHTTAVMQGAFNWGGGLVTPEQFYQAPILMQPVPRAPVLQSPNVLQQQQQMQLQQQAAFDDAPPMAQAAATLSAHELTLAVGSAPLQPQQQLQPTAARVTRQRQGAVSPTRTSSRTNSPRKPEFDRTFVYPPTAEFQHDDPTAREDDYDAEYAMHQQQMLAKQAYLLQQQQQQAGLEHQVEQLDIPQRPIHTPQPHLSTPRRDSARSAAADSSTTGTPKFQLQFRNQTGKQFNPYTESTKERATRKKLEVVPGADDEEAAPTSAGSATAAPITRPSSASPRKAKAAANAAISKPATAAPTTTASQPTQTPALQPTAKLQVQAGANSRRVTRSQSKSPRMGHTRLPSIQEALGQQPQGYLPIFLKPVDLEKSASAPGGHATGASLDAGLSFSALGGQQQLHSDKRAMPMHMRGPSLLDDITFDPVTGCAMMEPGALTNWLTGPAGSSSSIFGAGVSPGHSRETSHVRGESCSMWLNIPKEVPEEDGVEV